MRTKVLMGEEDTTVLLVYPSTLDEYRQAFATLGRPARAAEKAVSDPAAVESRPVRAAYVVTGATRHHLWDLPDLAASGRRAVVDEARALELLQDATRRSLAADELFDGPAGAAAGPSPAACAAPRRGWGRRPPWRRCSGGAPCAPASG